MNLSKSELERIANHPVKTLAAKIQVQDWVAQERRHYADVKWSGKNKVTNLEKMATEGISPYWMGFIGNYLRRAEMFGLDTLQGRQALGKALVTITACLEDAVLIHGKMPVPGVASGHIVEDVSLKGD